MTQIAMDVHKRRSTVAYATPALAEPKVARCLSTPEGFASVLQKLPRPWIIAVECSRQSSAVTRWLGELGADEVHLVDARALHQFTEDKPKSDARDAKEMLHLLHLGRLPECYLASEHERQLRALTRTRSLVAKFNTAVRNSIRTLLNQWGLGVCYTDLTGAGAQEQLAALAERLGPLVQIALQQLVVLLAMIPQCLSVLNAAIADQVAQEPLAQALDELPGIGPILALGLVAEIGRIDRFADPAHLISYAGLAPRANDSDSFHGPRKLPKRCNKRLRHLAVQAAQGARNSKHDSKAHRTYVRVAQRRPNHVAKLSAARTVLQEVFWRWRQATAPATAAA
jgi:transposase